MNRFKHDRAVTLDEIGKPEGNLHLEDAKTRTAMACDAQHQQVAQIVGAGDGLVAEQRGVPIDVEMVHFQVNDAPALETRGFAFF